MLHLKNSYICNTYTCVCFQILMSAVMEKMVALKLVQTLLEASLVDVIVVIYWTLTEELALVCSSNTYIDSYVIPDITGICTNNGIYSCTIFKIGHIDLLHFNAFLHNLYNSFVIQYFIQVPALLSLVVAVHVVVFVVARSGIAIVIHIVIS